MDHPEQIDQASSFSDPEKVYIIPDDVHLKTYGLRGGRKIGYSNDCTNLIIFPAGTSPKDLKIYGEYFKKLGDPDYYNEIGNNTISIVTPSTPITRAHLQAMSLFLGEIKFYYYEIGMNLYGYENYFQGSLRDKIKSDNMEFLYLYGKDLGLLGEIEDQVKLVKGFMDFNMIKNVEDVDDLGEFGPDGFTVDETIYEETWFFDSDGIKPYIQGG
ncbi:Hypothetical protein POVR1_LOCUS345 [uncultured virus]|nr:Hypothetical protein POVR1_LOCUS345 [uncultured virus]